MAIILTLCELCRGDYSDAYSVKRIAGKTTTEKKPYCEKCKRKMNPVDLSQFIVSKKGGLI